MKLRIILTLIVLVSISQNSHSANQGKITAMYFSGSESTWGPTHYDIVQLEIEGGYLSSNCDSRYAAIRKSDSHLVSAVLTAYASSKPITVQLNDAVTYWDGARCIIRDIIMTP